MTWVFGRMDGNLYSKNLQRIFKFQCRNCKKLDNFIGWLLQTVKLLSQRLISSIEIYGSESAKIWEKTRTNMIFAGKNRFWSFLYYALKICRQTGEIYLFESLLSFFFFRRLTDLKLLLKVLWEKMSGWFYMLTLRMKPLLHSFVIEKFHELWVIEMWLLSFPIHLCCTFDRFVCFINQSAIKSKSRDWLSKSIRTRTNFYHYMHSFEGESITSSFDKWILKIWKIIGHISNQASIRKILQNQQASNSVKWNYYSDCKRNVRSNLSIFSCMYMIVVILTIISYGFFLIHWAS